MVMHPVKVAGTMKVFIPDIKKLPKQYETGSGFTMEMVRYYILMSGDIILRAG